MKPMRSETIIPSHPNKLTVFKDVVRDIFPMKSPLDINSHKSAGLELKSQYKLTDNTLNSEESSSHMSFGLAIRKTASSLMFVEKLLRHLPSKQGIDQILNLNDPNDLEKVSLLLKKKKEARTVADIKLLAKSFETIDLFKEIKKGVEPILYERLFKELIYESFTANSLIFKENDPPDKLYIILSGEVYILNTKESNNSFQNIFKLDSSSMIEESIFPGYNIMNVMKKFQSFGEIALRNNTPRTASAACKAPCELISLDLKTFRLVLKAFFISQTSEKLDYLKKIPLFKSIPSLQLHGLLINLKEKKYRKGDIIYNEGSKLDSLYIIKEGEIQASKIIDLKKLKNKISEDNCNSQDKIIEILNQKDIEKFKDLNSSWARKLIKENKKTQAFFTLTKGQCFGEKGLINKRSEDEFSMICRSLEAVLYILPFEKITENIKSLEDNDFTLQVQSSYVKYKQQKTFMSKLMRTEGLILKGFNKKEEEKLQNKEIIKENPVKNDNKLEIISIRNIRPEKKAYETKDKAKYHYTTRYLPSNLLLKKEADIDKMEKTEGFKEFTLEKNLLKMFYPKGANIKKLNSISSEYNRLNKDYSLKSIRPFTEIVKTLESQTKTSMPNIILYKSLKVKDDAAQKVYKYCSEKLKTVTESSEKIKIKLEKTVKRKSLEKREESLDNMFNFCNFKKFNC